MSVLKNACAVNHSQVLCVHALQIPIPHVTCVTLGSPLVADKTFAEKFLELCKVGTTERTLDCTRIIHAMDPVPMVPPAQWGCVPCSSVLQLADAGDRDLTNSLAWSNEAGSYYASVGYKGFSGCSEGRIQTLKWKLEPSLCMCLFQ